MTQVIVSADLATAKGRQGLPTAPKPYYHAIEPGLHLGYRKGKRRVSWVVRMRTSRGYRSLTLDGRPDDDGPADGAKILDFEQAAREAYRIRTPDPVLHCSFCGKSQHDVPKLIGGPIFLPAVRQRLALLDDQKLRGLLDHGRTKMMHKRIWTGRSLSDMRHILSKGTLPEFGELLGSGRTARQTHYAVASSLADQESECLSMSLYICSDCVEICGDILDGTMPEKLRTPARETKA